MFILEGMHSSTPTLASNIILPFWLNKYMNSFWKKLGTSNHNFLTFGTQEKERKDSFPVFF